MNKAERSGLALTIAAFFVILAAIASYTFLARPWFLQWGAPGKDQTRPLLGDDAWIGGVVTGTRAVTIEAPPEKVWPWLVQIGQDRAGFYSYAWLENLVFADIHNTFEIRPAWQGREAKDVIRSVKPGFLFGLLKEKDGYYGLARPVRRPGAVDDAQDIGALSPSSRPGRARRGSSSGAAASPSPAFSGSSPASGSSTRSTSSWKRR